MAYMALYRKWRPTNFDEVQGQDPIIRALRNQILSDRVGHAYLFCGTRGTGKTSVAKIMARAVNCEHPVNGNPCNECASCRSIMAGTSIDVAEIDAASNNGVDNIREIREQVQYPPTAGKYRVYIIDEVHMLSPGAFNALLKTLEEPPAYVVFILATTEPNRLPITVLSRCQRYDFRRITTEQIAAWISHLLQEEKIEADEDGVRYIARAADGSMRDSLSLLEQCISFNFGERLSYVKVLEVLGAADQDIFCRLSGKIRTSDMRGCVEILDEVIASGKELGQFALDFTWYLRCLMLVQTADEGAEALEMSPEDYEALKQEASLHDMDELLRDIRIASELAGQLKLSANKRVLTETQLIRMMKPAMDEDTESLKIRIQQLEDRLAKGVVVQPAGNSALQTADAAAPVPAGGTQPVVEISAAEFEDYDMLRVNWQKIVGSQSAFIASILRGTNLGYDKERGLVILFADSFRYTAFSHGTRLEDFRKWVNNEYGKEFKISARLLSRGEAAPKVVRSSHIEGINMEIEQGTD